MLLSAVSVVVVPQPSSEVPEGLMNYPVLLFSYLCSAVHRIVSLKGIFVGTQVCSGTKVPRKQLILQYLLVYKSR